MNMKTTEEKSKAYDEALNWMRDLYSDLDIAAKEKAESIFPELAESEDEKVRKFLIKWVQDNYYHGTTEIPTKTLIAWPKKQGHTDGIIEKAKTEKQRVIITETNGNANIDWDTRSLEDARKLLECGLKYINTELAKQGKEDSSVQQAYEQGYTEGKRIERKHWIEKQADNEQKQYDIDILEKHITKDSISELAHTVIVRNGWEIVDVKDQKPVDKIEPKFKVGDWVVVSTTKGDRVVQIASVEYLKDGYPSYTTTEGRWFGNRTKARLLTDKDVETITLPESKIIVKQKHAKWSEEELTDFEKSLKHVMEETLECGDIHNLKADAELLLNLIQKPTDNDMVEALRTEYEKGRADVIAQMQQEWSEEDDYNSKLILSTISQDQDLSLETKNKLSSWFKSLKERCTWKPSDEQMEALYEETQKSDRIRDVRIVSLYDDLKKLTE